MITTLKFKRPELTPEQMEESRKRTQEALREWKEAQAELEMTCAELGIEVPVMVCAS